MYKSFRWQAMLYAEPAGKQQLSMKMSDLARRASITVFSRPTFFASPPDEDSERREFALLRVGPTGPPEQFWPPSSGDGWSLRHPLNTNDAARQPPFHSTEHSAGSSGPVDASSGHSASRLTRELRWRRSGESSRIFGSASVDASRRSLTVDRQASRS